MNFTPENENPTCELETVYFRVINLLVGVDAGVDLKLDQLRQEL